MPDYSLVPVDHEPDFSDASLVPVDHDPLSDEGTIQAQPLPAPPQPESAPQPPASGAGRLDAGAPTEPLTDRTPHSAPGDSYPTADAAAIAALQNIYPTSQRYGLEYAGRIYRTWLGLGDYSYTPPREGDSYKSDPGSSVLVPLVHSLGVNAGTYHTHTRGLDPERNENYSPGDRDLSDEEGAPAYLGTPSGTIYKYSPLQNNPSQGNVSVLGSTNRPSNNSRTPPGK